MHIYDQSLAFSAVRQTVRCLRVSFLCQCLVAAELFLQTTVHKMQEDSYSKMMHKNIDSFWHTYLRSRGIHNPSLSA